MTWHPGERVALVYTDNPRTRLRPGDEGTVRRYSTDFDVVDIDWDNGDWWSMPLNGRDRIRRISAPAPTQASGPTVTGPAGNGDSHRQWQQTLDAVRTAGAVAGRNAADWWAQDSIGGRATGDVRPTARRILAGIDDEDPAVLDTLPTLDLSGRCADSPGEADLYNAAALDEAPACEDLDAEQRRSVIEAYQDGFDTAVTDQVSALCRAAASPTGDDRDLSHLHPDALRIGGTGVFSGDWAWTYDTDGAARIPVGFVGVFIDTWNGWAVFSCTRDVAEAIVADQQQQRDSFRDSLVTQGRTAASAAAEVDQSMARLGFDGDTIVADQRDLHGDPEAIERIEPEERGRYVVMGRSWTWTAVDPADCDRIVGELPAAGEHQTFVMLTHSPFMRVPHDRLRVTAAPQTPAPDPEEQVGILEFEGDPVAALATDRSARWADNAAFGPPQMAAYVEQCRYLGERVTSAQVFDALLTECYVGQAVRQAAAQGATLARLDDEDGRILQVHPVWPSPKRPTGYRGLARHLTATYRHPRGVTWGIWNGYAWRRLANAAERTTSTPQTHTDGDATASRLLAYAIGDALIDRLDREQLIDHAAEHGMLLGPRMTDQQMRAAIRHQNARHARTDGLPVDDLPTLTAEQGLELGRLLTGGAPRPTGPDDPQQPPAQR